MNKRFRKALAVTAAAAFVGLGSVGVATSANAATVTQNFAAVDSGGVLNANNVVVVVGEQLKIQGRVYTVIGTRTAAGATSIRVNPSLPTSDNLKSLSVTVVS